MTGARNDDGIAKTGKQNSDGKPTQSAKQDGSYKMAIQKRSKPTIAGSAKNIKIRPSKQKVNKWPNVFVSRLYPELEAEDLKAYLEVELGILVKTDLVRKSDWHSSWHLTSECPDPSVFMNGDIWPERAIVRWWREKRSTTATNTTIEKTGSAMGNI